MAETFPAAARKRPRPPRVFAKSRGHLPNLPSPAEMRCMGSRAEISQANENKPTGLS